MDNAIPQYALSKDGRITHKKENHDYVDYKSCHNKSIRSHHHHDSFDNASIHKNNETVRKFRFFLQEIQDSFRDFQSMLISSKRKKDIDFSLVNGGVEIEYTNDIKILSLRFLFI